MKNKIKDGIQTGFEIITVLAVILFYLAIIAVPAYVVWHFLTKFW